MLIGSGQLSMAVGIRVNLAPREKLVQNLPTPSADLAVERDHSRTAG
jgi:hypothetical protein